VRELGMFAETANAVNRLIQGHLSINDACLAVSSFKITEYCEDQVFVNNRCDDVSRSSQDCDDDGDVSLNKASKHRYGSSEEDEEDVGIGCWSEEDDAEDSGVMEGDRRAAVKWTSLSTPGKSNLAKRRAFKMQQNSSKSSVDSGNLSGTSLPESVLQVERSMPAICMHFI